MAKPPTQIVQYLYLLTILASFLCVAANAAENLLQNGDFKTIPQQPASKSNWTPADPSKGISYTTDKKQSVLVLSQYKPGASVYVKQTVNLKPDMQALRLTVQCKATDIVKGLQVWDTAYIHTKFTDEQDRIYTSGFKFAPITGTDTKWKTLSSSALIPKGATQLTVAFNLRSCKSGKLEIDSVMLEAVDAKGIKRGPLTYIERDALAVIKKAGPTPQELHVQGNRIVNKDGKEVWLQGLAIASLEWSATGDGVLYSSQVAVDDWNANVIRLALKDKFWFGKGKYQKDGGKAYREYIDKIVELVNSRGKYVVLDLHKYRAPKEEDVVFWKDAASRYKNRPGVLFDLLNEPHGVSWEVWRNGGLAKRKQGSKDALSENKQKVITEKVLGMQDLVNAVRETGAKNIIIAGGLDWAYDLSGILKGYALEDKTGNGIVYSTHVYPWKSKWQERFIDVAAKHPIFMGEVGCMVDRMPFIPPERHEDPYKWAPDMLHVIKKYRINWTAWCFHTRASPCVISDWDYTPTPYWGVFVKQALNGKDDWPFKKLR